MRTDTSSIVPYITNSCTKHTCMGYYLIYTMGQIDQLLIRDVYTSKGSIFDCLVSTTHMIFLQACQHSRHASYMVTYRISYWRAQQRVSLFVLKGVFYILNWISFNYFRFQISQFIYLFEFGWYKLLYIPQTNLASSKFSNYFHEKTTKLPKGPYFL